MRVLLLLKCHCVYENGSNSSGTSDLHRVTISQILFDVLHRRAIGPKRDEFHVASTMEEQVDLLRNEPMRLFLIDIEVYFQQELGTLSADNDVSYSLEYKVCKSLCSVESKMCRERYEHKEASVGIVHCEVIL